MQLPTDISTLAQIEKKLNVCDFFQYKDSTSWISVKNLLTTNLYTNDIRIKTRSKKDIFSSKGIYVTFLSFKHILHIFRTRKTTLFLGASTGLFSHNDKTLDAYFPYYDQKEEDVIYAINCGNITQLIKNINYVKNNHLIVENYIFGSLKKLLSKLFILLKTKTTHYENFCIFLKKYDIYINDKKIKQSHYDFIAGYHIYRIFFKILSIKKAYIVSPTTKSDICAALKSLNIEIIEIQHGVVGKLHRGYNYNFKPNKLLPVPNKINVYNQFWADEIISAGYFTSEQINIVGRLKYDIVNEIKFIENNNYIIFTGQGAYIKDVVKLFIQSVKLLEDHKLKLIYKPHPRELPSELEFISEEIKPYKNLELYNGAYSTEVLIKNCFAHISIFSSCHFDAIYYNNRTYVFDIMDNNIMNYYNVTHREQFIKVKNIEEVIKNEINI